VAPQLICNDKAELNPKNTSILGGSGWEEKAPSSGYSLLSIDKADAMKSAVVVYGDG